MKKTVKMALLAVILLLPLMLSGCLPGIADYSPEHPAGFINGVWHGWCAPLSLIMELFGSDVRMFETVNTGFSYEIGFYMAVISGIGGLALFRRRRRG